jgi:hypothetical protein
MANNREALPLVLRGCSISYGKRLVYPLGMQASISSSDSVRSIGLPSLGSDKRCLCDILYSVPFPHPSSKSALNVLSMLFPFFQSISSSTLHLDVRTAVLLIGPADVQNVVTPIAAIVSPPTNKAGAGAGAEAEERYRVPLQQHPT